MQNLLVDSADAEKLILLAVERSYNDKSSLISEISDLIYEDIIIARSQREENYECAIHRQGGIYDLAIDGNLYASGELRYLKELISNHLQYKIDDIRLVKFEIKKKYQ